MKNLVESLNEGFTRVNIHWTNNDKKNFEAIADIFDGITASASDWMMEDDKNEDSDTASFIHQLSNLSAKLRGEWDDEIAFKNI